ncbi:MULTISPECIES: CU044_2847 family protein [unclassified Streptomyces]|uniref:CU044_2847 family protein n=1 Tax=unclassified Streptomyces TaxID=2593676 RepID=UPI0015E10E8E|nr:CU044_2847 family protein [Streptomyces sp. CB02959]
MSGETILVRTPLTPPEGDSPTAQVVVEVGTEETGVVRAARPGAIAATAAHSLAESFDQIRAAAEVALSQLTRLSVRPSTIELELGVKLNAEAGAVIAKTAAEGNFVLKLAWQADRATGERQADIEGPGGEPGRD